MPIRFATEQDVPSAVELGARMHQLTRFRALAFQPERVAHSLSQLITLGQNKYVFLLAEDSRKRVVGALVAVLEQHVFSDQLMASVMYFVVLPEHRMGGYGVRLLKAFEQWCSNRSVVEINLGINSGGEFDRAGGFVRKMGYQKIGENFVRTLAPMPP